MPLQHGLVCRDIAYDTAIAVAENASDIRITTDIPYLALTGELGCVYCEDLWENRTRFNGTALYLNIADDAWN